jgi:hypothetical protein
MSRYRAPRSSHTNGPDARVNCKCDNGSCDRFVPRGCKSQSDRDARRFAELSEGDEEVSGEFRAGSNGLDGIISTRSLERCRALCKW